MNVKIKRQIQRLWFLKELLQKILTNTYTDCLVAHFPVLEYLSSTSLYPINFKKTSPMSRKWKIDWGCECLLRMQSQEWNDFLYCFYMIAMLFSNDLFVSAIKLKNSSCGLSTLIIWIKFYHKINYVLQCDKKTCS